MFQVRFVWLSWARVIQAVAYFTLFLILEITNIATCIFLEAKIANGSYQRIDAEGKNGKEEVSAGSRFPTVGF